MKHIVDLAKNRGFVFQGSEIYGGLANTWDYGPLGSLLKENLKNLWIREFVQRRPDMVLLDAAILMNPQVWVASGHVGGFSDPLIDDKNTKERFRADKLMEDLFQTREQSGISRDIQQMEYLKKYGVPNLVPESWKPDQQHAFMVGEDVRNPNNPDVTADWTEIRKFNLMFETKQ